MNIPAPRAVRKRWLVLFVVVGLAPFLALKWLDPAFGFGLLMLWSFFVTAISGQASAYQYERRLKTFVRQVCGLERQLIRKIDAIGEKLGVGERDELAEQILDRLEKDQIEMVLIEYRKARGAALGLTFEAAADYPEAALDRKLDAILAAVEQPGVITRPAVGREPAPDAIRS